MHANGFSLVSAACRDLRKLTTMHHDAGHRRRAAMHGDGAHLVGDVLHQLVWKQPVADLYSVPWFRGGVGLAEVQRPASPAT